MQLIVQGMIALGLLVFANLAQAQNVHGVLRVVKGDVQIKSAKTSQMVKARLGEKVFPKDVIITGKDSRAKVVMVDNNELNVSPDSQIEIQNYEYDPEKGKKDVLLNVIYGKVRSKVEQKYDGKTTKFQIKTSGAVAGVRGTDFMMSFNQQNRQSQVVTFQGRVEFGTPGPGGSIANPVFVDPGKAASVGAGQSAPTAPREMPKEELAKVEQETKSEPPRQGESGGQPQGQESGSDKKQDGDKKEDSGDKAKGSDAKGDAGDKGKGSDAKSDAGDKGKGSDAKSDAGDKGKGSDAKSDTGNKGDSANKGGEKSEGGSSASGSGAKGAPGGSASGSSGGTGGQSSNDSSSGSSRQPASTGPAPTSGSGAPPPPPPGPSAGSGMFVSSDFASGDNRPPPIMPVAPAPPALPQLPALTPPSQQCGDFCNRLIQNGSTKLTIIINQPTTPVAP